MHAWYVVCTWIYGWVDAVGLMRSGWCGRAGVAGLVRLSWCIELMRLGWCGWVDMVDANFIPKPKIEPYKKIVEKFDLDPTKSILIEDIAHNLEQAKNLGMKTCWLENEETFAKKDADKPYIDYKIKNLPSFLQEINILKAQ